MKQLAWAVGILLYGLMFAVSQALDLTGWAVVVVEYSFWIIALILTRKTALKYFSKWKFATVGNLLFIVPIVYALFFRTAALNAANVLQLLSAALGEELAFRLFLPWLICEKCNFRAIGTLAISSLIFGLFHMVTVIGAPGLFSISFQVLYAGCIGFGLCAFVCEAGTLLPCVALHTLLNIFSVETPSVGAIAVYITADILFVGYGIYICIAGIRKKGRKIYYETIH